MLKFKYRLNLQFFNDEMGGGADESAPVIDSGSSVEGGEVAAPQPREGEQLETGAQPGAEDIEQSKSFAKRLEERTQAKLVEERARWEAENSQKYGDFDKYQKAINFFQSQAGYNNMDDMLQAIEQQELLERAAKEGVTPEYMQRLEQLEEKAKLADELQKEREEQEVYHQFSQKLKDYATENGLDPAELEAYMVENNVPDFKIAHKAWKADQLEQQLATAKEDAIKEYLGSKKAPKVEGSGGVGILSQEPTTDMNVARQRALARLRAANQQQ